MKPLLRISPLRSAAWALCALLAFSACNEDETEDTGSKPLGGKTPVVVTYTPEYTEAGLEVDAMIMGRNFGTERSNVKVTLGDTDLAVREVGNSVIKFSIPSTLDVGEYPIAVEIAYTDTEGTAKTVSHRFEVDFEVRGNKPEITGYTPAAGIYPGGEVTVEGQYFGSDKSLVTVKLGETTLDIASVAPGAIVFTVPEDTPIGTYALAVTVKYGVGGGQSTTKTFEGFQVLAKEYVATSMRYAGTGAQGVAREHNFFAPVSLAYDPATKLLYVGEINVGINVVSCTGDTGQILVKEDQTAYYLAGDWNPWASNNAKTCYLAQSGDKNTLYYTVKQASDRGCAFLWSATRAGSGEYPEATNHQAWDNDYMDLAVNPVDGAVIVTRYVWDAFRMESKFYLMTDLDGAMQEVGISPLWTNNMANMLFSPDGRWLYVSRSCDNANGVFAFISRYPYDPSTHTLDTSENGGLGQIVAGVKEDNAIGFVDGAAGTSRLNGPRQMCFDSTGEILYFVDQHNHALRKVTNQGGVWMTETVAGTGVKGTADVTNVPIPDLRSVQFDNPKGLAMADDNTFYICEDGDVKDIRRIEIKLKQ